MDYYRFLQLTDEKYFTGMHDFLKKEVGVKCPVTGTIALGVCTVTLWTPFPVAVPPAPAAVPEAMPAAEDGTITDEMIASLLADPFPASRRPRLKLAGLVPVVHGFAALATFMLAVLAAISAR